MENKDYASKGLAGTALGIGIGALGLSVLGGGLGSMLSGGMQTTSAPANAAPSCTYTQTCEGRIGQLESQIALLESENYADKAVGQAVAALEQKINTNLEKMYSFVIDLDKRTALNAQGLAYENQLTNNKIDCCCEKMNIKFDYENRLRDLADKAIVSYVNSTFLPGTLKLPITSVCPEPAVATTTTTTTPAA